MKPESRAVIDWYLQRTRKADRAEDPDLIHMRPQYEWDDTSRGVMGGEKTQDKDKEAAT